MPHLTYQTALVIHIAFGAGALLLFWAPMLARKGGTVHRNSGRWYYRVMMVVAMSALVLSAVNIIAPIAGRAVSFTDPDAQLTYIEQSRLRGVFLAQLAVLLFCNLQFGTSVLRARTDRAQLGTVRHLWPLAALLLMSVYSGMLGLQQGKILLVGFGVLGLFIASSNWRYVYAAEVPPRAWLAMHVRNIIPSGIAAYTAFFVVGASSWLGESSWRLLPWVAPGVVGSFVITHYSRKVLQGRKAGEPASGQLVEQHR